MLRFATVMLSNPAKPGIAPIEVRALVTDGDFGLAIGGNIAEKLELQEVDLREVTEIGKKGPCLVPYVGPVRITCGGKDVFTGAANCINGVAIGTKVARELYLESDTQAGGGFGTGLLPLGVNSKDDEKQKLASKILIKERVIDDATCRIIYEYVKNQKKQQTGVEVVENSIMPGAKSYKSIKDHARDAFSIDTKAINELLREIFYSVFTNHIMPFFDVNIESWERPQLLSYEKGGKYEPHADGELSVDKPGGKRIWRRFHNRDISILVYLNDEFTGGNLKFPDYGITVQPKPGLLVAFPSTADYLHGAEPTESGDRMVLVTWAAIEGTPRMIGEGGSDIFMSSFSNQD